MRLGVVSDTHGHLGYTTPAIAELLKLEVDVVLHCGDIGSAEIVDLFAPWPAHFVFGNIDDPLPLRKAIARAGQTCHEALGQLTLDDVRIAFLHGDDRQRLDQAISGGDYDVVCYGHTHRAEWHWAGGVLVLNPGALFRASPHTFAIVDLPARKARHIRLG